MTRAGLSPPSSQFAPEACPAVGVLRQRIGEQLDGDFAPEVAIACAVHLAHAARSERPDDLEWPEFCTLGQRHGSSCEDYSSLHRSGKRPAAVHAASGKDTRDHLVTARVMIKEVGGETDR
jgi:hypothetical protein